MKKVFLFVFFLLTVLPQLASQGSLEKSSKVSLGLRPRWNNMLDCASIEQRLLDEEVISLVPMAQFLSEIEHTSEFDNQVFVATLASGLRAVFKPGEDCYAEVAAYRASSYLAWNLVPPTVLRKLNDQLGSLQFFVEASVDLLKDSSSLELLSAIDTVRMKVFYFILGQWDVGFGNQLVQKNDARYFLALIDNAGMSNQVKARYGEPPFVRIGYSSIKNDRWDEPFPFDSSNTVEDISLDRAREIFGEFVSEQFLAKFIKRHGARISYVIWRNSLWIRFYAGTTFYKPVSLSEMPQQTLESCKNLTIDVLKRVWKEALEHSSSKKYLELISLVLERRDQLCSFYESKQ